MPPRRDARRDGVIAPRKAPIVKGVGVDAFSTDLIRFNRLKKVREAYAADKKKEIVYHEAKCNSCVCSIGGDSGNATAVFWRFTKDLEAGREQALTLSLPLANANAKYFDMMANEVAPKTNDDGSVELPLSNFPVYVRVPLGEAKVLADAFKNASVK